VSAGGNGFAATNVPVALCASTALRTLAGGAVCRAFKGVARELRLIDQATGS